MHVRVRTFRRWDKFRGNSTASMVAKSHFIASISARIHARKNTRILNFVQNHVDRCVLMLVAKNRAPLHVHPAWRGVLGESELIQRQTNVLIILYMCAGSATTLLAQFRAARSVWLNLRCSPPTHAFFRSVRDCLVIRGAKEHCVVVIDARRVRFPSDDRASR